MRIVIDTNIYISALINDNSRKRLDVVLANKAFDILVSDALLRELIEVANRSRFRNYVSVLQTETFIQLMMERATFIETVSEVKVSPDPKDDFLLVLCLDGEADYFWGVDAHAVHHFFERVVLDSLLSIYNRG